MTHWIRRLITLVLVAGATAGGALWWLYDGDLQQAVDPVMDDMVGAQAPASEPPAVP